MFPLILLVLGLGAVLAAYELSPRAHARIDDYARALRAAHDAHRIADVHLSNAAVAAGVAMQHAQRAAQGAETAPGQDGSPGQVPWIPQVPGVPPMVQVPQTPSMVQVPQAPSIQQAAQQASQGAGSAPIVQENLMSSRPAPAQVPAPPRTPPSRGVANAHAGAAQVATTAGVDHAIAATAANQQAAQSTEAAARTAKTEAERRAAADSAARVIDRGKKIAEALASLGAGQCGARTYARVTPKVRDTILAKLHAQGMTVMGDNPWDVDTQMSGVKLRAVWDPGTQVLRLIVVASAFYASCDAIWERLDPTLRGIIGP